MFVRTIQRKSSHRNIAVQIVESYRNDKGQPRQRILRHIGTAPEGEVLAVKAIGAQRDGEDAEVIAIVACELLRLLYWPPIALMMTINPFQLAMPALWSGSRMGCRLS